jgi:type VI secretion system protein ImpE
MGAAEEYVRAGRLDEALAELQAQVRKQPADPRPRVFLFQLLAVLGQWERALTQLDVLGDLDPTTIAMVQTYREVIRCEMLRAQVFAGSRTPLLFGKPSEWMALLVQALKLGCDEKFEEATDLRDRAFASAPSKSGRIDGQPFQWISDGDSRLGPTLEAVVNGRYYWIPFQRLREIRIDRPTDLRDLVWMPAHLTLVNGGKTVALIPARYPGSERAGDIPLAMGRATRWIERPGGHCEGLGQRQLATDEGEYPLMEVRVIEFDAVDSDAQDEGEDSGVAVPVGDGHEDADASAARDAKPDAR